MGVATVAYLSAGCFLHLRQRHREQFVTGLPSGTSREVVHRKLGMPGYAAPDGSEWLYYPTSSAFELPITPFYPTLYVRFSSAGTVSSAGILED